jgi:hypothetical protein
MVLTNGEAIPITARRSVTFRSDQKRKAQILPFRRVWQNEPNPAVNPTESSR